jgi:hypothetical protein
MGSVLLEGVCEEVPRSRCKRSGRWLECRLLRAVAFVLEGNCGKIDG